MLEAMERMNFIFKGIGAVIVIEVVVLTGSLFG